MKCFMSNLRLDDENYVTSTTRKNDTTCLVFLDVDVFSMMSSVLLGKSDRHEG